MKAKPLLKKRNLLNLFECLESWFSFYTSTISDIFFFAFFWDLLGMGTFQKKKWEKKCGARDNPGQGERRMSYYRDRGEWLLFLGQPAAPTIHPYASEIMLSAFKETHCQTSLIFYCFFFPEFVFFWKRSEVAYVAWSFIFTFIYSIATSNMPKSHIRWRGEQIQFIETSYCSDNFHKISNFCRLLGKTFMKEILVVFQTYSCLL